MQIALPTEVSHQEIAREKSLGGAISLCAKVAGYEPKELQAALSLDKAQWSRWESNQEGITWEKFRRVMDFCGNHAPVLWMLHECGYDLSSLRRMETQVEKENRLLREENAALKRVLTGGTR